MELGSFQRECLGLKEDFGIREDSKERNNRIREDFGIGGIPKKKIIELGRILELEGLRRRNQRIRKDS